MRHSHPPERNKLGLGALLRCALMLMALLGALALNSSPVRAQQDPEHDALVRALRMQEPSDPMWQAMMQIATVIAPHQKMTEIVGKRTVGVPPNTKVFHQLFHRLDIRGKYHFGYDGGIALLSFGGADEASRHAASTDATNLQGIYWTRPACRRIVGGRHVIELRGYAACFISLSDEQVRAYRAPVLNPLVEQANKTLAALPPGTAAQPPVTQQQPPVSQTQPPTSIPPKLTYARSGDKGNSANIAIIARKPKYVPLLRRELTPERILEHFGHLVGGPAVRFEAPGLNALNFLISDALGGGGMASMRIDPQGKAYGQMALEMIVNVPTSWAEELAAYESA